MCSFRCRGHCRHNGDRRSVAMDCHTAAGDVVYSQGHNLTTMTTMTIDHPLHAQNTAHYHILHIGAGDGEGVPSPFKKSIKIFFGQCKIRTLLIFQTYILRQKCLPSKYIELLRLLLTRTFLHSKLATSLPLVSIISCTARKKHL